MSINQPFGGIEGAYFGAMLQYDWNDTWYISAGVNHSGIGYYFRIKWTKNPDGTSNRSGMGVWYGFTGVPVQVGYTWRDIHFIRLNRDSKFLEKLRWNKQDLMYLFLFKVQFVAGIAINHVQHHTGDNQTGLTIWQSNNNPEQWREEGYYIKRKVGVSVTAGVNIQFHSFGRDRLLLSVLYEQGIQNRIDIPTVWHRCGGVSSHSLGCAGLGAYHQGKLSYSVGSVQKTKRSGGIKTV
jgi:hypothetical protein